MPSSYKQMVDAKISRNFPQTKLWLNKGGTTIGQTEQQGSVLYLRFLLSKT